MLDFEQVSLVQPATLVTIVTEAVLKDSLITLLKNLQVKGYTITEVNGEGRCPRLVESASEPNDEDTAQTSVEMHVETTVEIRAVVTTEISNVILYALKEHQHHFAIVAYRQQVEALGEY
jgi:nitrogen regulatory protein PII